MKVGKLSSKSSPLQKLPNANSPFLVISSSTFSILSMHPKQHSSHETPSNRILNDPDSRLYPLTSPATAFSSFLWCLSFFLTYFLVFRISLHGSFSTMKTTISRIRHWQQQDMTTQSAASMFKSSMACCWMTERLEELEEKLCWSYKENKSFLGREKMPYPRGRILSRVKQ